MDYLDKMILQLVLAWMDIMIIKYNLIAKNVQIDVNNAYYKMYAYLV